MSQILQCQSRQGHLAVVSVDRAPSPEKVAYKHCAGASLGNQCAHQLTSVDRTKPASSAQEDFIFPQRSGTACVYCIPLSVQQQTYTKRPRPQENSSSSVLMKPNLTLWNHWLRLCWVAPLFSGHVCIPRSISSEQQAEAETGAFCGAT